MKFFILSLLFMISVSFSGNPVETNANFSSCTDCWSYADGYEAGSGSWQEGYDDCNENLNPCAEPLDEVIVED